MCVTTACKCIGEINNNPRGGQGVVCNVSTIATHQRVSTLPTNQDVIALATQQNVIAATTVEAIVGVVANQCVIKIRPRQMFKRNQLVTSGITTRSRTIHQ